MLVKALEVEVGEYIDRHRMERDERGHAVVVRNGSRGLCRYLCRAPVLAALSVPLAPIQWRLGRRCTGSSLTSRRLQNTVPS